jgi:hypothetical protein
VEKPSDDINSRLFLMNKKGLSVKKFKKISNPSIGSYLVNEPNFCLLKEVFLYDFVILKKVKKKQGSSLAIPHMLGLPPPPPPAKHVRYFSQLKLILGHSVQLPSV